jgi:hypothetical protein
MRAGRPHFAVSSRWLPIAAQSLPCAPRLNMKKAGLMADHQILDLELFLLELVKADIVRVGAVFLFVDERLELCMLLFEGLDLGLIHRTVSFHPLD